MADLLPRSHSVLLLLLSLHFALTSNESCDSMGFRRSIYVIDQTQTAKQPVLRLYRPYSS